MADGEWWLGHEGVARDPLEVGGVGGGPPKPVHGGAARRGEADDGGGYRWSLGVPEWSVMGHTFSFGEKPADLQTCRTSCEEHFLFSMCGPIQLQLILKIFRLSLMVHNVQLFENSNFPINFK
jgi:hypothetical protein